MNEGFTEGQYVKRGNEIPSAMPEHMDTARAWKSKGVGYKLRRVFYNKVTTDNYEDSLIFDARLISKVLIQIKEKGGTNDINFKIFACLDPHFGWETLKPETTLSGGSKTYETSTEPWNFYKVQVKSALAGNAGKVDVLIGGKTP